MKSAKFCVAYALALLLLSQLTYGQAVSASSQALTAKTILAKWTAAIGGAERAAQARMIYRHSKTSEGGMEGVREEWVTSRLQRKEVERHSHFQSTTVFDGAQGWLNDWNGKTRLLQGEDAKQETVTAILHSFAAVNGKAGAVEYTGQDAYGRLILKFQPQGGLPATYYLDPATYLPAKAEFQISRVPISVEFSDWRDTGGLKIPFKETETILSRKTVTVYEEIRVNGSEKVSFTKPKDARDSFILSNKPSASVPFNFENNHLMVMTEVNGSSPIWFMIDTGARFTVISQERLNQFNLKSYGGLKTQGGGNDVTGAYVDGVTYRLSDVEVRNQHAAVLSLQGLEKVYGMPLGGILGYDFVSRFVIQADYPSSTLTLFDPARFEYKGKGIVVPFILKSNNHPYIEGSVTVQNRNIPALFVLDTGAADTMTLTTPFVKENNLAELAGDPRMRVNRIAGSEKEFFAPTTMRGLLDKVTIGQVTLPHVVVNFSLGTSGAYASSSFSGNIGETILQRFKMILDYEHTRMILEPGPEAYAPFEERRSFGATFTSDGPDFKIFRVTGVGANSPAKRAGLQTGDIITALDSVPAINLTIGQLRKIFTEDGTTHTLKVQRKNEELKIPVTIERLPISDLK
ncbi:MAG: aspartyl protease family protein [Pyrinomonadaceae bacterium]|nr:aspartyl protease family protein [Pyrinomonadaceae bacterium]